VKAAGNKPVQRRQAEAGRSPRGRPGAGGAARATALAPPGRATRAERSPARQIGLAMLWLLVLVPPFVIFPQARESFRMPKLLVAEWLGLASLLALAWELRGWEAVGWRAAWKRAAVRAALPFAVAATLGLATTRHPLQVREGLIDLWIGAACLVGWSLALPAAKLAGALRALVVPAVALAVVGILQYHGIWRPLALAGQAFDPRLGITSTAGNPGDLGDFLVLPCLIAQAGLAAGAGGARSRRRRAALAAALAIVAYGLALSQTLSALAALLAGTVVLWVVLLPRRRALLAGGLAGLAALAVALVLLVPPLRQRAVAKLGQAAHGDWNAVLTGRLDGWRAAAWMVAGHPLTGVGEGAYLPEYVPAKLALLDRGSVFYAGPRQGVFANAHDEPLEVAAETGLIGLAALGWGLWVLLGALRRSSHLSGGAGFDDAERRRAALAWAGAAALLVLSLFHFPFRIALAGYPALLFLAWVLRRGDEAAPGGAGAAEAG
jgi:O-antigen ligase